LLNLEVRNENNHLEIKSTTQVEDVKEEPQEIQISASRPLLRSIGIEKSYEVDNSMVNNIEKEVANPKQTKPAFDFTQLEDMDDILLDEIDSQESDDEKLNSANDEISTMVKKFHSDNQMSIKINLEEEHPLLKMHSVQFRERRMVRSKTVKYTKSRDHSEEDDVERDMLKEQLKNANQEIERYQNFVLQIQKAVNWSNVDMSQAKVHVCFLFASPLLRKIKNGYEQVMLLDYVSEMKNIESNLRQVDYQIKYSKSVATQRNFHSFISDRPIVLHFSGHGIVNDHKSMGNDYAFVKDKGNILLLEDENGMSDYLFEKDLKAMVEIMDVKFEVVFIASWHSEFAGKIFSNAGARHVIWIKGEEKISDEAALKFTEVFYDMMFVKQYSVCQSYEIAKSEVKRINFEAEANKFLLLTKQDDPKNKHECKPLFNFSPGKFKSLWKDPEYNIIPPIQKDFKGRQREMYDLMLLLSDHRFVCLHAIEGMGKTAMLKNFCHHMKHRSQFTDGIMFVDWNDIKSVNEITTFKGKILLVLDNIDNLILRNADEVCIFIKNLINTHEEVAILMASRLPLQGISYLQKATFELIRLSDSESLRFLLDKCPRVIASTEIAEIVKSVDDWKNLLMHPFTQLLKGHPGTIIDAANRLENMSMLKVYEYMKQ